MNGVSENMKIINSSVVGGKHTASGIECEDRTASLIFNDVYAVAVADGAGAKKYDYAADGAECVVSTITEFLCKNFDKLYENNDNEYLGKVIVSVCRKQLQKRAEELNVDDITRMSSTLLAVAVKGDKVIVCHIGDGVIGKLTPTGVEFITNPDNGEFAGTTYFVTSAAAMSRARVIKTKVGDSLSFFLMSDGAADFLVHNDGRFAAAAEKMAKLVFKPDGQEQLENILKDYMVAREASSDDCSYACIGITDNVKKCVIPVVETEDEEPIKKEEKEKNDVVNQKIITGLIAFICLLLAVIVCLAGIIISDSTSDKTTTQTIIESTTDILSHTENNSGCSDSFESEESENSEMVQASELTIGKTDSVTEKTETTTRKSELTSKYNEVTTGRFFRLFN